MRILGIETSCDETSAAVVEDGRSILSNVVASQIDLHQKYGGIVPEVASRKHVELILPVIQEALDEAGCRLEEIDAVAVINRPGLIGALIVGVSAAKAIACALDKPLIAVHHLAGHIYANFLADPDIEFPFVCLVVSGGHSDIVYMPEHGTYRILGRTRDDAAGEAFDKCARAMGLGYPGGPIIDKLAEKGNPQAIKFPRANLGGSLDFSFSGLKTAVIRFVARDAGATSIEDVAASFQQAVVDVLVENTLKAARDKAVRRVLIAGGVAANSALRRLMRERAESLGIAVSAPPPGLCTDNAAMAAAAAHFNYEEGVKDGPRMDTFATEALGEREGMSRL
ncbi:MAG: tRNA (adenosine(37)-N6)-threonylcarbamoyltransferase complex transferase subunit TsaD [Armatimonadota bacterium]|nr:tRNA (adenosine(37)-N6)-threonylcarbamoyltransferase complex transferase subunit TsaD [Armatimonadota bacterium]